MIPSKPKGIPKHFRDFTRLPRKWKKYMKKYGGTTPVVYRRPKDPMGFAFDFTGCITYDEWFEKHCMQNLKLVLGNDCESLTMSDDGMDWAWGKCIPDGRG